MNKNDQGNEFCRWVKARTLPAEPLTVEAIEAECAALAERFALPAIASLRAELALENDGKAVLARGNLTAEIVQSCAVSGEHFPVSVSEQLLLRFVEDSAIDPALSEEEEEEIEIELTEEDCDEIEYAGEAFDLGEAVAQSLGLAIDPYAEGPNADAARKAAGITGDDAPSGPLANALKALKKD